MDFSVALVNALTYTPLSRMCHSSSLSTVPVQHYELHRWLACSIVSLLCLLSGERSQATSLLHQIKSNIQAHGVHFISMERMISCICVFLIQPAVLPLFEPYQLSLLGRQRYYISVKITTSSNQVPRTKGYFVWWFHPNK